MEENFNIHLGKKLRMRRLSLGLTQTKVAQAINVTFQQIQKYEKGTNGVSSNRLMQLSQFLKVPIIYFFEDFKEFKDVSIGENTNANIRNLVVKESNVCVANKDGSYTKIKNAAFEKCNIGLAAFNKKGYYDPSKIEISVINFADNNYNILRDKLNKIVLGGWEHRDPNTIDENILKKIYE